MNKINKDFLGYAIKGYKDVWGFWNFNAITYKHKGFKEEMFNSLNLNTYEHNKLKALNEIEALILNVVNTGIVWQNNGQTNNKMLLSIKA